MRVNGGNITEVNERFLAQSDWDDLCIFALQNTAIWWLQKIANHHEWVERRKQLKGDDHEAE